MATCLENVVSIRGACTETASNSGLYLDDVDVTLREIENYVTGDYTNAEKLALDKIKFASKKVAAEINTYMQPRYTSNSIIDGQRIGYNLYNKETVAASAKMRGIEIELCKNDSYLQVHISTLDLFVNFSGAVNVFVYDMVQGLLLDTIAVTAVAGQVVTTNVNKTYSARRKGMDLAIIYDVTAIDQYKTEVSVGGCSSCGTGNIRSINSYISTRGISVGVGDAKINSNLTGDGYTGGLSIVYSVNCDRESWLCSIQNVIAMPILYAAAVDLMRFAIDYSDQFNTTTRIDFERLKNRHDYYLTKYKETINNILPSMKLPNDSLCFECVDRVRSRVTLP